MEGEGGSKGRVMGEGGEGGQVKTQWFMVGVLGIAAHLRRVVFSKKMVGSGRGWGGYKLVEFSGGVKVVNDDGQN